MPDNDPTYSFLADLERKSAAPIGGAYTFGNGNYGYGSTSMFGLGFGPRSVADVPVYLNVVVSSCIAWLSRNFPVADLHVIGVTTVGDGPEIEDHPFIELMDRPNAINTFHSFWQSYILSDVIDGNTFFIKVRDRTGAIASLWWVPPWDVNVVPDGDRSSERPIKRYEVMAGGKVQEYAPEDVIHIKDGIDPVNPYRGLAALKSATRSTSTIDRAELFSQTLMGNCGAIPIVISPAGSEMIPENAVAALKAGYAARQTEFANGTPLFPTYGMKVDKLGLTPEEMAIDQIYEWPVAFACSSIGMSPMVIGLPDAGKTYANKEAAEKDAWQNGLIPRQARAAEAFDRQCPELIHPTKERLKWDYAHVKALQDDFNKKVEGLSKAVGGPFMLPNEARDMLHLDPIPGGDELVKPAPPPGQVALGPDGKPLPLPKPNQPKPGLPGAKPPPKALPAPTKAITLKVLEKADEDSIRVPFGDDEHEEALDYLLAVADDLGLSDRYLSDDLTQAETLLLLHEVCEATADRLSEAAEVLANEMKGVRSAIKGFFTKAGKLLKTGLLAAALVLNGPGVMDAETKEVFVAQVVEQEVFLKNFEAEVTSGTQPPDGTLAARAKMYGRSSWGVAQNTVRGVAKLRGMVQERRVHVGSDTPCKDCVEEQEKGWSPVGSLKAIGDSECLSSCHCHFLYEDASGRVYEVPRRGRRRVKSAPAGEKAVRHRLRGRHAQDMRQRHARAGGSGHGYNPNRDAQGRFASGPHHDERGVWQGRSDGPTLHAGTEQYAATRQAGVATYARQVGHEHGQDVRIAFTPPKGPKESTAAAKAREKGRHLVETTVEPKHRVETQGENTRHVVGGENVAEVRRSDSGKHWVSRETIPGLPGEHSDFPYRSRAGAEKRANRVARASIREDTDRGYHAPKDLHEHFGKVSGEYRQGIAETHTIRHRIITHGEKR